MEIPAKVVRDLRIPLPPMSLQKAVALLLDFEYRRLCGERGDLPALPPPLSDQRRIVARIEELAGRIDEVLNLRKDVIAATPMLAISAISTLVDDCQPTLLTIRELIGPDGLQNGQSVKSDGSESETRCLMLSAMQNGRIDVRHSKPVPLSPAAAVPFTVKRGDVFIMRGNGSKHLCGRAALVEHDVEDLIFPDLFIRTVIPREKVIPEFFVAIWNASKTRALIEQRAKTMSGIWKINQGDILAIPISIPSILEQQRILAKLTALQTKLDSLAQLQATSTAEFDMLMTTVLDRAFKGEL